jgi:hypothetical protein
MERRQKVLRRKEYSDNLRAQQGVFTPLQRVTTIPIVTHPVLMPRPIYLPTVYQTQSFLRDNYEEYSNLQDVTVGLIKKKIVTNTKVTISVNDNSFCVICQEKPDFGDVLRLLQCNHTFHIECIDTWFCDNKTCPICKQEI